jgi:hypothetical protein
MAYARLLDGSNGKKIVVDYTEADPGQFFVASLAAEFVEVPDGTENGMEQQEDGSFDEPFADPGLSAKEAQALEEAGEAVPAGPGGDTIYDANMNVLTEVPE